MGIIKKSVTIFFGIILITMLASVFAINGDDDNDGIPNTQDQCTHTPRNTFVDQHGCSIDQFCGQFICGLSCDLADWKNDETGNPQDCKTVIVENEGQLTPRCIPDDPICPKNVTVAIPQNEIAFKVKFQGQSYWNTTLYNVPDGFGEIHNGSYLGWCFEKDVFITQNTLHNATLYSSYDPDLALKCPRAASDNWDLVNYLLNHKQGTKEQIQDAIWYLLLDGSLPSSSISKAMINDSINNGENFLPLPGENFAVVVCSTNSTAQLTFIEVDP